MKAAADFGDPIALCESILICIKKQHLRIAIVNGSAAERQNSLREILKRRLVHPAIVGVSRWLCEMTSNLDGKAASGNNSATQAKFVS